MFALWRTCQHYSTPDSPAEAKSASLAVLLAAAADLPSVGRFRQFVARASGSGWVGVGFVSDGSIRDPKPVELAKYDRCRVGLLTFSNSAYPVLTAADHPRRTVDLDL